MNFEFIRMENESRFWESELSSGNITVRSGKIGGKPRERIHSPKTSLGKTNPEWEVKTLIWKKFKEGYHRCVTEKELPLLFQVPTPEHLKSYVDIFPDNKRAVVLQDSDGNGSRIHILNLQNGESQLILKHDAFLIKSARCYKDDKIIFTPQTDYGWQTVMLDINTGEQEVLSENRFTQMGDILEIAGDRLLCATGDNEYQVLNLIDRRVILTASRIRTKHGFGSENTFSMCGGFLALAFQPDDESEMNLIRIHDLENGQSYECRTEQNMPIDGLTWSEKYLFLFERFSAMSMWELDGSIKKIGEAEKCDGCDLRITPDGKSVSMYQGGRLVLLGAEDGKIRHRMEDTLHHKAGSAHFIKEDRVLFTGGGVISLYQLGHT